MCQVNDTDVPLFHQLFTIKDEKYLSIMLNTVSICQEFPVTNHKSTALNGSDYKLFRTNIG